MTVSERKDIVSENPDGVSDNLILMVDQAGDFIKVVENSNNLLFYEGERGRTYIIPLKRGRFRDELGDLLLAITVHEEKVYINTREYNGSSDCISKTKSLLKDIHVHQTLKNEYREESDLSYRIINTCLSGDTDVSNALFEIDTDVDFSILTQNYYY